jgi:putative nucleotidyltransferase with HDIG domain
MGTLNNLKLKSFLKIDKELIIIFLLVAITGFIFYFVVNQRAFLNFFYLPVVLGAYLFGKRYATLAAFLSIILITIVAYVYPFTFIFASDSIPMYRWLDLTTWGAFLLITGYAMGLLYEKKEQALRDIEETYQGILEMLSIVIDSVDKETHNHSYRVSIIAEQIAMKMECTREEVENIRIAALLHDLGKIGTSGEVLNKMGSLTEEERAHLKKHTKHGVELLQPVGGKVLELLPIILHHHERFDGKGYNAMPGKDIPLGARIIAVADVYDALISDRPYRKALSSFLAMDEIVNNSGTQFDPEVVKIFEIVAPKLHTDSPLFMGTAFTRAA